MDVINLNDTNNVIKKNNRLKKSSAGKIFNKIQKKDILLLNKRIFSTLPIISTYIYKTEENLPTISFHLSLLPPEHKNPKINYDKRRYHKLYYIYIFS